MARPRARRPEPRFIGDPARPVFAWHHAPPASAARGAGIVLCPPLGHEYLSAYRSWRVVADTLAASGFDVVRVEYDGTGSSAGMTDDPGRVDGWLASIASAIAFARSSAGTRAVALIGLRAGALVAIEAAARDGDVDRVVAWSPFSSGRALVRELRALSGLTVERGAVADADDGGVNAAGYVFDRETLDALGAWTPESIATRPAPDILLVDHDERPIDTRLEPLLHARGSRVTRVRPAGTAAMLVPPQHAAVPVDVVRAIAGWLDDWHPGRATRAGQSTTAMDRDAASVDGWIERPLRFGPGARLFGLLTTPAPGRPPRPSVVVLGTGVEFQAGQHRLYVPLAREWASCGHAVLRFDLGGIGESLAPPGAPDDETYPAHALEDVRDAIAVLREAAPDQPVLLVGFCSGGLAAFRAAAAGLDVAGIACVNAPLQEGAGDAGLARLRDAREIGRYRRSLSDRSKWRKAFAGRVSYGTLAALSVRAVRARMRDVLAGRLGARVQGLAADLEALARRGVRAVFAFSDSDDGLAYFDAESAAAFRRPAVRRLVSRVVVAGAGHTFRPRAAQRALRELLDGFVRSARSLRG